MDLMILKVFSKLDDSMILFYASMKLKQIMVNSTSLVEVINFTRIIH